MSRNIYNGGSGKFNWWKIGVTLALWLGVGALWLSWWPESGLADPPDPGLTAEQLEEFWQQAYGDNDIGAQQIDQFLATMNWELLAKAPPDACYDGIGNPYPPGPPCATGQLKVNQAYVWGLAKPGADLWFGTAANVHCLVLGGYLDLTLPLETDSWVCEFGASQLSQNNPPGLPAQIGDWRPPDLYVYNTQTETLTEKTGDVTGLGAVALGQTLGIRSAGTISNVVILAGPAITPTGSLNMFAFDTTSGDYLGFAQFSEYNNIRKWLAVEGVLYTAVGNTAGGGSVLRWRGDAGDPFQFEVVGVLDGAGAELALHDGRLFVSTWPSGFGSAMAGIYMSPPIPAGGLTTTDAGAWTKVWEADDYEPDPVTAATYGAGALASYGGYLYWGTMHVPFLSTVAHLQYYQTFTYTYPFNDPVVDIPRAVLGTYRPITVFRGQNFDTTPEIELLYGLPILPVASYDPFIDYVRWDLYPNNMFATPSMGLSGFGNFFNNYTWTMDTYEDQLFVGTMDWSYLGSELLELVLEPIISDTIDISIELPPPIGVGADLFRFPAPNALAVPESIEGVGNYSNYGVRTMIADDNLYLGMANPMNLLTDPNDGVPEGGWELLSLSSPVELYLPIIFKE